MTQRDYEGLYGKKYGDKKETRIIQLKYAKADKITKALGQIKTKIGKIIADEGSNTIVIIDAPEALSQAEELLEKLDKPTTTVIFELNYASTADLKDKIENILTKGVGEIQIDERTNKILITDLKERIDEIEKIIIAFDAKSQQVLIDTKIIEITLTDEFKLGVDWEAVMKILEKTIEKPITIKSTFGLASAGGFSTGTEFLVGDFSANDETLVIQALKTIGDVNTLSNPRIMVLNNEEAKILIGTSEPYAINTVTQSGDLATTGTELSFLDVGVKLYVTPTINRNGFVTMKIKPEVSSSTENYEYGDPATQVPIVSTTQAETSLMVKNGNTIIIAGLIKDDRSDDTSEMPFLGDIPILGWAFKKTEKRIQKKELVMFITPHIVSGEEDYIRVPEYLIIDEKRFTTPEEPTFYRRKPVEMSPAYLHEKDGPAPDIFLDKLIKEEGVKDERARETERIKALRRRPSSPDEYFSLVKGEILNNLSGLEDDPRIKMGDKVKVYFRLYSGGNLVASPRITESTNEYLSGKVTEAIERSAPFAPFPLSIREFKKDFSLDIVYDGNSMSRGNGL
jgi:type II secretory pathway component GspD/PulD (secretin)